MKKNYIIINLKIIYSKKKELKFFLFINNYQKNPQLYNLNYNHCNGGMFCVCSNLVHRQTSECIAYGAYRYFKQIS